MERHGSNLWHLGQIELIFGYKEDGKILEWNKKWYTVMNVFVSKTTSFLETEVPTGHATCCVWRR